MGWVAQGSNASNSVPLEAVAITAGAVVIGAIIAAVAAHMRLRGTLKAERERLDDQLTAERERLDHQLEAEGTRLDRQLEHDRELTDLAELRTLLDRVMADVFAAYDAYHKLLLDCEEELADPVPTDPQELRDLMQERSKLILGDLRASRQIIVDYLHVWARVPGDHAVLKAYWGAREAFSNRAEPDDDPVTPEKIEAMRASSEAIWNAQGKLIVASAERPDLPFVAGALLRRHAAAACSGNLRLALRPLAQLRDGAARPRARLRPMSSARTARAVRARTRPAASSRRYAGLSRRDDRASASPRVPV
jgi:hypothetical protein